MLAHCGEWHALCPLLKGLAVDAEAIVAGQRHEVGIFPGAVALSGPLGNGLGLLFQPLSLQGGYPGMHGECTQRGDDLVAGRIVIGLQQFLIVGANRVGDVQHELRQVFAPLVPHVGIGLFHHVQHHVIIGLVAVVVVQVPVGRALVNLNVAHP